jgi:hypothetical protein
MFELLKEERGSAIAYMSFLVIVIVGALVWIAMNELILHVGDWVSASGAANGGTWNDLIILNRITPVIVLISSFTWAVVKAHRGEGFG